MADSFEDEHEFEGGREKTRLLVHPNEDDPQGLMIVTSQLRSGSGMLELSHHLDPQRVARLCDLLSAWLAERGRP